jgi:phenylacetate-CoA ligase
VEAHLGTLRKNELYLNRYWVNGTSGSTGKRGIFLFDPREWATVIAGFGRANLWAGFEMGVLRRKRIATVASRVPWHMSFRIMATFDPFQPNVLSLDAGKPVESLVESLNAWRPRMLAGYPSSLRALAREQLAARLRIDPDVVFSGGEVLSGDARSLVREAWGREVFDVYGSTEAGSVASECGRHRGLHVHEDMVVLEVVDERNRPVVPGDYGAKALVTVLFNRTQPLIRYELSDRLRFASSRCPCGRPYPLIESVEGRAEEMLDFPAASGGRIALHPLAFEQILDVVPAAEWQIVHEPGRLLVLLAGAREGYRDETIAQFLSDALTARGAVLPVIEVERVASIPRGATGKAAIVKKHIKDISME